MRVRQRGIAVTVSGEPHKTTGVTLGEIEPLDHLPDRVPFDLWG